jgi:hypothetical protein
LEEWITPHSPTVPALVSFDGGALLFPHLVAPIIAEAWPSFLFPRVRDVTACMLGCSFYFFFAFAPADIESS